MQVIYRILYITYYLLYLLSVMISANYNQLYLDKNRQLFNYMKLIISLCTLCYNMFYILNLKQVTLTRKFLYSCVVI